MKWLKRLLCFHPTWVPNLLRPYDWRTGERWWYCHRCGKEKNFGMDNIPVNFLEKP